MKVKVNTNLISDAPYQVGDAGPYVFDDNEINNFVSEIIYGKQTCYLVSGYRGVGKTSFINRVQELVQTKSDSHIYKNDKRILPLDKNKPETYYPVFVYTSFAKYNNQTTFLRQMIRSLYLAFESKQLNKKPLLSLLTESVRQELIILNQRTFFDVKTQYEISKVSSTEIKTELGANVRDLATGIINSILPLIGVIGIETLTMFFDWTRSITILSGIVALIWCFFGIMQIRAIKINRMTKNHSTSAYELYDDEIASHYFGKILKTLKNEGFKIVFILDELDKVNEKELSNLVNEMKPHLLSGLADYIVVAGQQLTYKYVSAFSEDDDEVVGSLFSKVFHVSLKKTSNLHNTVKKTIFQTESLTDSEKEILDDYIHQHIFYSTLIPRILMNQIRQAVIWNDNEPYITLPDAIPKRKYQELIKHIEGIVKDTIETRGHKEVIRDYLIVQLYRTAIKLTKSEGKTVQHTAILGKFQKSTFFHHPLYFDELAPCLTKLIARLAPVLDVSIAVEETHWQDYDEDSINQSKNEIEPTDIESKNIFSNAISLSLDSFQREVNECRGILKAIFQAIDADPSLDVNDISTYDLLKAFVKNGFLKLTLPENSEFKQFLGKQTIQGTRENLYRAYLLSQDSSIDFNSISYNLLESYLQRALNIVFKEYTHFKLTDDLESDYLLMNPVPEFPDVLLNYKFIKSDITNIKISDVVEGLARYNVRTGKGNHFAYVIFTLDANGAVASELLRLHADLQSGSHGVFENKIKFISVSVQALTEIYDELVILKNNILEYKIDTSGIPTSADFSIIPNMAFTFKNQHTLSVDKTRNDHLLPFVSKTPSELIIIIRPIKTKYWRFGLKFSRDGKFPNFEDGRHVEGYPDIHISVGEPKSENGQALLVNGNFVWNDQQMLKVTNYFITPKEKDWTFNTYNGESVKINLTSTADQTSILKVYVDENYVNTFTFKDDRLKFFKISAWADHSNFELETQILTSNNDADIRTGGKVLMASPNHPATSVITGEILASKVGVFSIWGFVADIHNKIFGEALNMYLVGYASNGGQELRNPSLARYPNAWAICRTCPTHKNHLGQWKFFCNDVQKESTQLTYGNVLTNGWHLFSVAWSKDRNYIKFIIDDDVVDESPFKNWPTDFSHAITTGIWPSGGQQFFFNSKVGQWQFVERPFDNAIIKSILSNRPE